MGLREKTTKNCVGDGGHPPPVAGGDQQGGGEGWGCGGNKNVEEILGG